MNKKFKKIVALIFVAVATYVFLDIRINDRVHVSSEETAVLRNTQSQHNATAKDSKEALPTFAATQKPSARGTVPCVVTPQGELDEAHVARIDELGIRRFGFIPPNGLLVEMTRVQFDAVASDKLFAKVAERNASEKIDPAFAKATADRPAVVEATVLTCTAEDVEPMSRVIAELGGNVSWSGARDEGIIRAALPLESLPSLAAHGEVKWIERWFEPHVCNNKAVQANELNIATVWSNLGLTGTNQVVAVVDTGLDTGDASTVLADFRGRVLGMETVGVGTDCVDREGHGTHVSGSFWGSGALSGGTYKGVAYEAKAVFFGAYSTTDWSFDPQFFGFDQSISTYNYRIGCHSWGSSNDGLYGAYSKYADKAVVANPGLVLAIAAGNVKTEDQRLNTESPGTAKNAITVGNSLNYAWRQNGTLRNETSCYSTMDGRYKPDLMAYGTDVVSTRSTQCDYPSISGNSNYAQMTGTSQATPFVAGCATLTRQWLQEKKSISDPSSALIKAILTGGTTAARPTFETGWGLVNLGNSLMPSQGQVFLKDRLTLTAESTRVAKYTATSAAPLVVQLAWIDPWLEATDGKTLVIDHDLIVSNVTQNVGYRGNDFDRTGVRDSVNNVEGVRGVTTRAGDVYEIYVTGKTTQAGKGTSVPALYIVGALSEEGGSNPPDDPINPPDDPPVNPDFKLRYHYAFNGDYQPDKSAEYSLTFKGENPTGASNFTDCRTDKGLVSKDDGNNPCCPYGEGLLWPDDWTIATSAKLVDSQGAVVFMLGAKAAYGFGLVALDKGDVGVISRNANSTSFTALVSTNVSTCASQYHHYAVTYESKTQALTFYVDGEFAGSTTCKPFSNDKFQFMSLHGGFANTGLNRVSGVVIDDWRMYDGAMDAAGVASLAAEFPAWPKPDDGGDEPGGGGEGGEGGGEEPGGEEPGWDDPVVPTDGVVVDASGAGDFMTIQAAVNAAKAGDTIYVRPGRYAAMSFGKVMRLVATGKAGETIIDGGGNGSCANYPTFNEANWSRTAAHPGPTLEGFTLCNGYADNGGGAFGCNLVRCVIEKCFANFYGGGAYGCRLVNCVVNGNSGGFNGGIAFSYATGATIYGNTAATDVEGETSAGLVESTVKNSILWENRVTDDLNQLSNFDSRSTVSYSCTSPSPTTGVSGGGNITGTPRFVDTANGDFRLRTGSAGIDAASGEASEEDTDLNGDARVQGNAPDMGACEGVVDGFVISGRVVGNGTLTPMTAVVEGGKSVTLTASGSRNVVSFTSNRGHSANGSTLTINNVTEDLVVTVVFETNTLYVDADKGDDSKDGLTWNTAKKTIQSALDAALDDEKICVKDGVYPPISLSARDVAPRVTIESVYGKEGTIIDGDGKDCCAFLMNSTNVVLKGFTLRNGYTPYTGGGVYGGMLIDCDIVGNTAAQGGGGTYRTTAVRCRIVGNTVTGVPGIGTGDGGGAMEGQLESCLLACNTNKAAHAQGGASYGATCNNCTIVNNVITSASGEYASVANAFVSGSILYGNVRNGLSSNAPEEDGGQNLVGTDPLFVDYAGGDYRLTANSPAIDQGVTTYGDAGLDLAGAPRVSGGKMDIGAYEYQFALFSPNETTYLSASRQSGSVAIESSTTWTASTTDGWITLGVSSGSGYASVPWSVEANETGAERTGTITFTSAGGDTLDVSLVQIEAVAVPPAGTCYGLFIGVNEYADPANNLSGCVTDATSLRQACVEKGYWDEMNTVLLTNSKATVAAVREQINALAAKAVPGDTVLYFQSSHGTDSLSGVQTGSGQPPTTYDGQHPAAICLHDADYSDEQMASDLARFKSGVKIVVFLDTCHSGGMFKSKALKAKPAKGAGGARTVNDFATRVNAILSSRPSVKSVAASGTRSAGVSAGDIGWITAADWNQYSFDTANGALFTSKALEGWREGSADIDEDDVLNFYELWSFAWDVAREDGTAGQCLNERALLRVPAGVPDSAINVPGQIAQAVGYMGAGWTLSGDRNWRVSGETAWQGGTSAQSGKISDGQSSVLSTTVTGPGYISFYWKVSSESGRDTLSCRVDGEAVETISGERGWTQVEIPIMEEGVHTVSWVYSKDASGSSGSDCGWLDGVSWEAAQMYDDYNLPLTRTLGTALEWMTTYQDYGDGMTCDDWGGAIVGGVRCAYIDYYNGAEGVLSTTVEGAGTLTFDWRIETDGNDHLDFRVNGTTTNSILGNTAWASVSISLEEGTHSFAWALVRGNAEDYRGYVRKIVWTPKTDDDWPAVWSGNPPSDIEAKFSDWKASYAQGRVLTAADESAFLLGIPPDGTAKTISIDGISIGPDGKVTISAGVGNANGKVYILYGDTPTSLNKAKEIQAPSNSITLDKAGEGRFYRIFVGYDAPFGVTAANTP